MTFLWTLLFHRLEVLDVLTLHTLTSTSTFFTWAVALTIFLQAVALLAATFHCHRVRSTQKKPLSVATGHTLAVGSAGQSQFETFAIVFLASGLCACAFADRSLNMFGTSVCLSRSIWRLEPCFFYLLVLLLRERSWLVVIVQGCYLFVLRFGHKKVKKIWIIFCFIKSIEKDHNLLLCLHWLTHSFLVH